MAGSLAARGGRGGARAGAVEPRDDQPRGRTGAAQVMSVAGNLTAHVGGFCRSLRGRGLPVGPKEAADALPALAAVDVSNRRGGLLALPGVLPPCFLVADVLPVGFSVGWEWPAPH